MPERLDEKFSAYVNTALREYEQERGIQVRYVPKIHPSTSSAAILRLEEVIEKAESLKATPTLLINQFGRPLSLSICRRAERIDQVVSFVKGEFDQFREGQINRLSSYRVLCERFGYKSPGSIRLLLIRHGLERPSRPKPESQVVKPAAQTDLLKSKRRVRRNTKEIRDISTPSEQMAWMLGVLSAGGYTKPGIGTLSLHSKERSLAQAFQLIGEELFGLNAYTDTTPKGSIIVSFSSKALTSALGDLRSENWPFAIMERYSWITDSEQYVWRFLEGYLDKSGVVRNSKAVKRIGFFAQYENAGNFLAEMLIKVGVERPVFHRKGSGRLAGVFVDNIRDIKRIAENINLKSAQKNKALEELRDYTPRFERPANSTDNDLIEEWRKLKRFLGHAPTSYDIQELKRKKETRCDYKAYADKFGGGSFVKASEYLEIVISEKGQ